MSMESLPIPPSIDLLVGVVAVAYQLLLFGLSPLAKSSFRLRILLEDNVPPA